MTDAQSDILPGERGITPVAGTDADKKVSLQRGLGAIGLTTFAALIIWGTWRGEKPASDPAHTKLPIRQAAAFEPAKEPPKPDLTDVTGVIPHTAPVVQPAPVTDQLMESARRAPVLAYSKQAQTGRAARDPFAPDPSAYALGAAEAQPRSELLDKLKSTPLEGVRASRLPNRNLIVTQGTSIPCVLETAMSSDVPGFVSCVVQRDVMSDSGNVVLMEKGTQIVGEYRGDLKRGSQRLFVLWIRAKTPTGVIVALSSPATDALGRTGFDGEVNNHFWQRFGAALLLSIAGDASAIGRQQLQNNEIQINNSTGTPNNAAAIVVDRSINIPPTLTKNQGELVNVFVARDLDFSSVYRLRRIESREGPYRAPYTFEPTRALVTKP